MRLFITGATGFIGTKLVKELLQAGHQVRGLRRSDDAAEQLKAAGAEVQPGSIEDLESLRTGATGMDAVVNLAFSDDMTKFAESAEHEIKAIEAMGAVLDPGKLLIVTSGVALVEAGPGELRTEFDPPVESPQIPRKPEQAAVAAQARGVHVGIVRNSQIHDTHKQGLVMFLIQIARAKGVSAYVGDGAKSMGGGSGRRCGASLSTGRRKDRSGIDHLPRCG